MSDVQGLLTGTPSAPPAADPKVKQVQETLKTLGFPVEITGLMDDQTSQALRAFQSEQGLPVTGELDDETSGKLIGGAKSPNARTKQTDARTKQTDARTKQNADIAKTLFPDQR